MRPRVCAYVCVCFILFLDYYFSIDVHFEFILFQEIIDYISCHVFLLFHVISSLYRLSIFMFFVYLYSCFLYIYIHVYFIFYIYIQFSLFNKLIFIVF